MSENINEQLNIADAKGGNNNEGGESSRLKFEVSADNPELSKTTDQLNDLRAMVAGDKQINSETLQKIREHILALQNKENKYIAHNQAEINENTKVYIGSLFPGIFSTNIEYIYTSYPEGKIERGVLRIGGISKDELKKEIKNKKDEGGKNYRISNNAEFIMNSSNFTTAEKLEEMNLVKLKVGDLGFGDKNPTTDEIYARIKEFGLELCPAETGPHLRIDYEEVFKKKQPINEDLRVGMKQITGSGGRPSVFGVDRGDSGSWLSCHWAKPDDEWLPGPRFVFRLRKCET